MIAKAREYSESSKKYYRLIWSFDSENRFCDELKIIPDAVVLLHSDVSETGSGLEDNWSAQSQPISFRFTFTEFYGLYHKVLTVDFIKNSDKFKINSTNALIPNHKSLIYCGQHPEHVVWKYPILECQVSDKEEQQTFEAGSDSDNDSDNWAYILVILYIYC